MNRYEYRCVNAPTGLVVDNNKDRDNAIKRYENIINKVAADNWEYVGMDSYTTEVKPGCLNSSPQQIRHRMLVFRREVSN